MQSTIIATVSLLTVLTTLGIEPETDAPEPSDAATPLIADAQRPSDAIAARNARSQRAFTELKTALEQPELDDGQQLATDIERLNHERAQRQGVAVTPAKRLNYPHAPERVRKLTLRDALYELESVPACSNRYIRRGVREELPAHKK